MVKIIADSTCDLSPDLIDKYGIRILPLFVRMDEEERIDGVNVTPDELFAWSDKTKKTPMTAAPTLDSILQTYEEELEKADELVVFAIASGMSSTCSNCITAAGMSDAPERIHVIDSANLSTGIGLLVIRAALMASLGSSGKEIAEEMERLKPLVRASFVVDTLVFLHRGGRCSGTEMILGNILRLHPRIEVKDGAMHPAKKYRGSVKSYVMNYVKDMEPDLKKAQKDRVFITHSGCSDEILERVKTYLESLQVFDEILITRAGSVISSHCGPGTLGVLFIAGEE